FGNVALLLLAGLLYAGSFRRLSPPQRLFCFLPVPFLLFQLNWELTLWATASIQNLYVCVFALLAFYALDRSAERPAWFAIAGAAAFCATFTNGNGMFTFALGAPLLALNKRYRWLAIWLGVGMLSVGLYFWSYEEPVDHPPIIASLLKP